MVLVRPAALQLGGKSPLAPLAICFGKEKSIMPQEVNPMIHVSDFDFPHEPYHCDDPEKKKLVIKLAKMIKDF